MPAAVNIRLAQPASPPSADVVLAMEDKQVALEVLEKLADEEGVAEVAMRARFAEVRLAAACRLSSSAALERVAQASRGKDKGVYRHCCSVLRGRETALRDEKRAAQFRQELAAVEAGEPIIAPRLQQLERDFAALAAALPDAGDCAQRIEAIRARLMGRTQLVQALHARCGEAELLQAEIGACQLPTPELYENWQSRRQGLASAVDPASLPAWLQADKAAARQAQTLHENLAAIDEKLHAIGEDLARWEAWNAFVDSLTAGEAKSEMEELLRSWQELPKPNNAGLRAQVEARWEKARPRPAAAVRAAPPPKAGPDPALMAELRQKIAAMEQALEEGALAAARTIETELVDHDATLPQALAPRLAQARARLGQLAGWARWGTDQARAELIAEAQALASPATNVETLAVAIPGLRGRWQALDAQGSASKAQWQRFNEALQKAYAPLARHRAAEKARQAEAAARKEALCAELEAWLAGIDWSAADYKAAQSKRQEAVRQWQEIGPAAAGYAAERKLRKRFEAWVKTVDARLAQARRETSSRYEALINEAAALVEAPELGPAIERAKALQEEWRQASTVRLPRAEQEELWQRFRAACDALFARRDEERAQRSARQAARQGELQAALAALDAVLKGESCAAIEQALAKVRSFLPDEQRGNGGRERARAAEAHPAAQAALRQAQARIEALRRQERQAPYALLQRKAGIVDSLEQAVAAGLPLEQAQGAAREEWQALAKLPDKFERPLASRLENAGTATPAALAEGRLRRNALLLDLEIGLDLPSPAERADARRARRLELLQDRFRDDRGAADHEALLLQWLATAAASDPSEPSRLAAILEKLAAR